MSIKSKDISFLTLSTNHFLFNIDFLYEHFKAVLNKNISNKEQLLEQLVYLKGFIANRNSDIELAYERLISFKREELEKGNFKLNFIQLLKAYSIFYNYGLFKTFKLSTHQSIKQYQIISKKLANEIKSTLDK